MSHYRFTDPTNKTVETPAGFVPWGTEGPLGGGEAWGQWEADGKPTPARYVAPPAPPRSIHAAWFQLALSDMGHLAAVNAAVAGLSVTKQILWNKATEFSEADPDVNAVAAALGIDLKAVFDRAEAIRDARS